MGDRVVMRRVVGPRRRRLSGLRIVSTETGRSLGAGAEVRGPDVDLLLVASGRRAALTTLDGSGVTTLSARLP